MYHIKLCKAQSFSGVVTATALCPDVYIQDEKTANAALATGYFRLVETIADKETEPSKPAGTAHLDPDQLADLTVDKLKQLAADMDVDISKATKKAEIIEAICAAEVTPGDELDGDGEPNYGEDQ